MSYILDALRRAEADRERERGQVPGLHTHPTSGRETASATARRRWLPWAGAGLLLLAGVGVGSWWASGSQEAAPVPTPGAVPPSPVATAPASMPAVPPPIVAAPAPQLPASASPYLPPAPPPGVVAAAPAPAAPTAPPAEARIPRLAELPDTLRREVPALAISGSVYSDDPAGRFVIINGEVQREGARLSADLVLEQIRQRELVMRFKGQRYRMPV